MDEELIALRKRVKQQRKELRRLNRMMELFWHGWGHHGHIARESEYRLKMIKAFGLDKIMEVEKW